MRTLVDIEKPQLEKLDQHASRHKRSRAAVIRQAVAEYLKKHEEGGLKEAFGLWRDREVDGLEYQEKMRSEW